MTRFLANLDYFEEGAFSCIWISRYFNLGKARSNGLLGILKKARCNLIGPFSIAVEKYSIRSYNERESF